MAGEVLILLRHCWRDAFFCVRVGSGSFCHDWASLCSVLFWSFDALFFDNKGTLYLGRD